MQEMIVIFLVALLLFGPKKLPELGKTIAKAMTEFRRAQSDLKATFDREMQNIERETDSIKETTKQAAVEIKGYSDFDLVGGDNHFGTLDATPTDAPASESSNVSASAAPGADSPAGSSAASDALSPEAQADGTPTAPASPLRVEVAGGTVPRGTVPAKVVEEEPAVEAAPHS